MLRHRQLTIEIDMIKEGKNVDLYTTGRQPSEQDFARISEWIKSDKQKRTAPPATSRTPKRRY